MEWLSHLEHRSARCRAVSAYTGELRGGERLFALGDWSTMSDSISSGGITYDAVWLRCELTPSFRPDEVVVHIPAADAPEPLTYYVHPDFVRYDRGQPDPGAKAAEPGRVLVIRLSEGDSGELLVEVPGEPASFGPRVTVRSDLVAA